MDKRLRRVRARTIMVLISNARYLGIETVCTGSLLPILFQSKYSLLKINSITAYMGVEIFRTNDRVTKQNNEHLSHHTPYWYEVMMV